MAEHQQPPKNVLPEKGPSTSQVLAVLTLIPVGGVLLLLSALTLAGSLIGLVLTTPIFVIFSPVLVPAALTIGLAVTGFLTSGAFGISALSSLTWIVNYFRKMRSSMPEQFEQAKRRVHDTTGHLTHRAKEAGQRTQEAART